MECGNISQWQAVELTQEHLSKTLLGGKEIFLKGFAHPFAHFLSCGFGKCHDQEAFDIHRMIPIDNSAQQAFNQDCRLP